MASRNLKAPVKTPVASPLTDSITSVRKRYGKKTGVRLMRRWAFGSVVAALFLQVGVACAEEGLQLHLRFDEGKGALAADSSGRGNGATVRGDATWVGGAAGQALKFEGKTFVIAPDPRGMKIEDEITVAFWAAFPNLRPADYLLSLRSADPAAEIGFHIRTGYEDGWLAANWRGAEPAQKASCYLRAAKGDGMNFYALTVQGTKARFYVSGEPSQVYFDGKRFDEWDCGVPLKEATKDAGLLIIGSGLAAVFSRSLNGVLDEFRIYNRALSPGEIKALFGSYAFNDYPNVVANSSFETASLGDWPDRWVSLRNGYSEDIRKDLNVTLDEQTAHGGKRSMRIEVGKETAAHYPLFDLRQYFVVEPVLPGQYTASAWMKTDSPGMKIQVGCADGGGWETFTPTQEWQRYWFKLTPFKTVYRRFIGLQVVPSKTGRIWVDDVMIARGEEPLVYRPAPREDPGRQGPEAGAPELPIPSVVVPRLLATPILDGQLDEACWASGGRTDPFVTPDGNAYPGPSTRVRIGHDDEALYLAFECADPNIARKSAIVHPRDSAELWKDDLVEIFVDADVTDETYNQMVFSCAGAQWDCKLQFLRETIGATKFVREADIPWNGEWQVAVSRSAQGWCAEVRVPWSLFSAQLGKPADFRFNLTRTVTDAAFTASCWSASPASYHCPWRFGTAKDFAPNWDPYRVWIRRAQALPIPGRNEARLRFEGWQAAERDRQLAVWRRLAGEADWQPVGVARVQGARAFAVEADAAIPSAEQKAACDVKITEGDHTCHVGRLEVRAATPLLLSVPNRMVVGQAFSATLAVGYPAESLKDAVVRWSVSGDKGAILEEETPARSGENVLRAPAVAAPGVTHVQAELFAGGKSLGREKAEVVFLPADQPVVSLTPEGMQLNGKPFIPLCMYAGRTVIASYAAHGINSVFLGIGRDQVTASDEALRAYVDSHAIQGMRIIAHIGWAATDYLEDQKLAETELVEKRLDMMARIVRTLRGHPAIVAWHTVDEPSSHRFLMRTPEHLARMYQTIKKEDPDRPVLCNDGTLGLRNRYTIVGTSDAVLWDDYTWPVGTAQRPMEQAQEFVHLAAEWGRDTARPVFCHIGSNHGALPNCIRDHTPAEMRCEMFLRLVGGARGVFFYSGPPSSNNAWNGIKSACEQVTRTTEAWFNPIREVEVRPEDGRVAHYLGRMGDRWTLVAVNPTHEERETTLRLSGATVPDQKAPVLFEGERAVTVERNGLRDTFGPYAVHLYSLKP